MISLLDVQADRNVPGIEISYWIGRSLPIVLLAVGVLWCLLRLRRPSVNKPGMVALALALFVLILSIIVGGSPGSTAGIASTVLAVISLLAAFVLSIIALVNGTPGRGPAIAALILSSLTGLGILFFAATTVLMKARDSAAKGSARAGTGQPIELAAERFRIKTLPPPWVKVADPKKLNKLACVAVSRTQPEMYCIVIAEFIDPGTQMDLDLYVAAVKSNLLRGDPGAKTEDERPETINGSEGARMLATARVSNINIFYRYWMHSAPGRVYQVILWGPERDRARILTESGALFSNIEIVAPKE